MLVALLAACRAWLPGEPAFKAERDVACADAQFAALSDDAAVAAEIEGVLDQAVETDSRLFEFDLAADQPTIDVAYVKDVAVDEFFCNDVMTADNDGDLDEVWPAVGGTATLQLADVGKPNACGERRTGAVLELANVRFRAPGEREVKIDALTISGAIGWFPPGC